MALSVRDGSGLGFVDLDSVARVSLNTIMEALKFIAEKAEHALWDRLDIITPLLDRKLITMKHVRDFNEDAQLAWSAHRRIYLGLRERDINVDIPPAPPFLGVSAVRTADLFINVNDGGGAETDIAGPNIKIILIDKLPQQPASRGVSFLGVAPIAVGFWYAAAIALAGVAAIILVQELAGWLGGTDGLKAKTDYQRVALEEKTRRLEAFRECLVIRPGASVSECSTAADKAVPTTEPPDTKTFLGGLTSLLTVGLVGAAGLIILNRFASR